MRPRSVFLLNFQDGLRAIRQRIQKLNNCRKATGNQITRNGTRHPDLVVHFPVEGMDESINEDQSSV